jgi:hypothetical protein
MKPLADLFTFERSFSRPKQNSTDATFRGLMAASFEPRLDLNRRKTRRLVRPM